MAIVSFQNGVQKDELLRKHIPAETIMGGVCYIAATIAEPGVIRHTGTMQRLVFGEYNGTKSGRGEAFHKTCLGAGIDAELTDSIERQIWEKFVFLVGFSGVTSITRQSDFAENRLVFCDALPAAMTSSMQTDLERGNQLELPWLSGSVVELGAALGVSTPVNRVISDALELDSQGGR